ncbi:MAG: prepilin-type N-terminal cleavage/methylation domain-containing protein [Elusimicrobia bacterium]|nr:prepilin-type N-terminal cleavage/methylation domain-containing protein [Elusimicrobiota bacterium]
MTTAPRRRAGFTLLEMIIALVLSSFVIMGIFGAVSQMMRGHMESSAKATNSAWALMGLDSMQKELSNGTVLYCPFTDGSHRGCPGKTSTVLSGCSDYTPNPGAGLGPAGGPLDGNALSVKSSYYSVWDAASTPTKTPWLLHYTGTSCPIDPAPACGSGSYDVVAQDIYPNDPALDFYFRRADDVAGVQLLFTIGQQTRSANGQAPAFSKVDTRVQMQKSFSNPYD